MPRLAFSPVKVARPEDGVPVPMTDKPPLRSTTGMITPGMGGPLMGRRLRGGVGEGEGRNGVAELGCGIASELGVSSCVPTGFCVSWVPWPSDEGACAISKIGETRKHETIFQAIRMRDLRAGRKHDALTSKDATIHYDAH